jgi:hypothetical protein
VKRYLLIFLFFLHLPVFAHAGAHKKYQSIFDKTYKYKINSDTEHIGHFYVRRSKVTKKSNEFLQIIHTIHLDSDLEDRLKIKYTERTSFLNYRLNFDNYIYYFKFYIVDDFLNSSSPGSMVVFNKETKEYSSENVQLEPVEDNGSDHMH